MKKIKRRAFCALLAAVGILCGMGIYVYRFFTQGQDWVHLSSNRNLYQSGVLMAGTLTDRNGVRLASVRDGRRVFADRPETRAACLHAIGDRNGNIGTGALTAFADLLDGYSPVSGISDGGGTAKLSLDAALCETANAALNGRPGAVLVSDYTTGGILCMVSSPNYDPDAGFDLSDPRFDGVYLNRCISAAYPPGSTMKLMTAAAAIDYMPDFQKLRFNCTGSTLVDGSTVKCTGIHGEQTMEQALANSCNCAFAQLSLELGGKTLSDYAARLGLSGALSLDGITTASGKFDASPDDTAALAWSGIGQSTDLVTPFSMLRFVSAIANGGVAAEPTLLLGKSGKTTRLLKETTAQTLAQMMNYNVVYSYGTENYPGLSLCAKSGTAELGSGVSHAWFTGFLQDPEHPYAFVVLIENAGSGARNAGPAANSILQAAIKK